jgi:predicted enzyme related to lactoylglutathione lyase
MLKNALAFTAVRDIDEAVRFYRMLLGREPDAQPMEGLAEWKFEDGGWLQVNENRLLAGRSSVTLVETDIDERMSMLTRAGIKPRSFVQGEAVSVVIIVDPDGNQVVFAQGKDENHRSTT